MPAPSDVLAYVGAHVAERHILAHGAGSAPLLFTAGQIRTKIETFETIVQALDARAGGLVQRSTGAAPW